MSKPTLYLMLGYPGAGKTTTAEFIQQLTGAERLTSDQVRLELFNQPQFTSEEHAALYKTLDERTEALLAEGKGVIYDANLNRRAHRDEKYSICERTGARPVVVWVQTAKELAKSRATDMNRSHLVPQNETAAQMFDRIANIIEEPEADEPYASIDGTNLTPEYVAQQLDISPMERTHEL